MSALLADGTADKEVTDLCGPTNLLGRARALAPKLRERDLTRPQSRPDTRRNDRRFLGFQAELFIAAEKIWRPANTPRCRAADAPRSAVPKLLAKERQDDLGYSFGVVGKWPMPAAG
jgi:hypothetical protein